MGESKVCGLCKLSKMCDETTHGSCSGDPPVVHYYCPGFYTLECGGGDKQPFQQPCPKTACFKNRDKINGLAVELAVRRPPYNAIYPKKPAVCKPKKPKAEPPPELPSHNKYDPNCLLLERSINSPDWDSRFCLRRIYYLVSRDVGHSQDEERVWALWSLYEKKAKDVFTFENVDVIANIILVLSTSFVTLRYAKSLFDKVMERLQRGIYVESTLGKPLDVKKFAYFFTLLGLAIVEGHPIVQASISSILAVWLEQIMENRHNQHLQQSTSQRNVKATKVKSTITGHLIKPSTQVAIRVPDSVLIASLEKSLLSRAISEYFIDGAHTEGYIAILTLLKTCCDVSPVIRDRLLELRTLEGVLMKVSIEDTSSKILVATCDFVHSYFGINAISQPYRNDSTTDKETKSNNHGAMLEKDSFQILLTRFAQEMANCPSKSALNIRNDIAFLICVIGGKIPDCGHYFEGFGLLIASIVSGAILGVKAIPITYIIDSTPEDLELLQYLIFMLKCVLESGHGELMIEEYSTVAALTRLIFGPCRLTTTPSGCSMLINGEGEKCNDLENTAWTTILAIAQHYPLSLLTPHGVPMLLSYVQTFGETGVGDENTLVMCMHTIRIILTTPEEESCISDEVMNYFILRNGMAIFIVVLIQLLGCDFNPLQDTLVANTLHSCAALASSDYLQKFDFLALGGVTLLIKLMSYLISDSINRRQLSPLSQMAAVECVSCCVAYFPQALEEFLAMEGIYRLLDLLEVSTGPAAPLHLVNCLVQLSEYPRAMDQLLQWHPASKPNFGERGVPRHGDNLREVSSTPDQSLFSLLCSLWKDEEERFAVLRDPEGCIESISHPLMSKFAREYVTDGEEAPCKACLDLTFSIRPKIFLLIKRIVETVKTEALLLDGLRLEDQVIMHSIINFVDIKKSEIFLEVYQDFGKVEPPLPPTVSDSALKMVRVVRNTLATVLETQRFLIRRINEKEEMNEVEFYALVKRCRLQDHLLAATEVQFLARTTNYRFLVEKRLWQKSELQGTLEDLTADFVKTSRIHRISDGDLNITAWPSQKRSIISEPKVTGEATLANYNDNDEPSITTADSGSKEALEAEEDPEGNLSVNPSELGLLSKVNLNPSTMHVVASSTMSGNATPEPFESGYYQVSPLSLREALGKLAAHQRKHEKWLGLADQDEENCWKLRAKWRKDWYPIANQ